MIGCIVTGHGSFAPGLAGAVEMIAGPQEYFKMVAFSEEEAFDVFEKKMNQAVVDLQSECSEILVFADLLGGTPFRTAMLAAQGKESVQVIAGANLPSILEFLGLRYGDANLESLMKGALNAGKDGLVHGELILNNENASEEEEEGI